MTHQTGAPAPLSSAATRHWAAPFLAFAAAHVIALAAVVMVVISTVYGFRPTA